MYKTTLFGKTREFTELAKLITYAQGVRDASPLSNKELLFEFRVYKWNARRQVWIENDLFAKYIGK